MTFQFSVYLPGCEDIFEEDHDTLRQAELRAKDIVTEGYFVVNPPKQLPGEGCYVGPSLVNWVKVIQL